MINYPVMTADEAARLIKNDYVLGIGGFSSVGVPKAVPSALARYAIEEHEAGRPFKVGLITGGATGPAVDTELALAKAVKFRTPFQSNSNMRNAINAGEVDYFDCHLSMIGQDVFYGFLFKLGNARKALSVFSAHFTVAGKVRPVLTWPDRQLLIRIIHQQPVLVQQIAEHLFPETFHARLQCQFGVLAADVHRVVLYASSLTHIPVCAIFSDKLIFSQQALPAENEPLCLISCNRHHHFYNA